MEEKKAEEKKKDKGGEKRTVKKIYIAVLVLIVSFWVVVGVVAVSFSRISSDLKATQERLEEVSGFVETFDMELLNDTIETIDKVITPLKDLLGK